MGIVGLFWAIVWLLVLIFIAFWVAGIACGPYVVLLPFTVCIEPCTPLTNLLLWLVQFPRYCALHMVQGRGPFSH